MSALTRLHLEHLKRSQGSPSSKQGQTQDTFGYKWAKRDTYESKVVQEAARRWLFERYCGGDPSVLDHWLDATQGPKLLLDAGCGAGHSGMLFFNKHLQNHDYLGVDISDAVDVASQRFLEQGFPGDFLQCDLMDLPIPDGSVDLIFSEGVLHHTDSTEQAIKSLARKLKPGGRFLFYVYALKSPIREFTDDRIRAELAPLSNEEAWHALEPLTRLGITLGELGVNVEIKEDIPLLGIPKGTIDLQRLFYWHICKAFYRPDWTLDEMNHVNFDWFRPLNCHRQTPSQVTAWVEEAGLDLEVLTVEEAGISIVACRA